MNECFQKFKRKVRESRKLVKAIACVINSTWQRLSTISELWDLVIKKYMLNFSISKLFYWEITEQCRQYISTQSDPVRRSARDALHGYCL